MAWVVEPTFVGNDNPAAPQAGILRFEVDVPARAEVEVVGGGEQWALELSPATEVDKPIVGLKPDTAYSLTVSVTAGDNTLTTDGLEWRTPALPGDFPPWEVRMSHPSEMEPGMTLFSPRENWQTTQGPIVIVDHEGVVRWYFRDQDHKVQEDLRQLENGNFLFGHDFCSLQEVDLLGNVVAMWHATEYPGGCDASSESVGVPVVDFHHDSLVLPNGNLLALSSEARTVDGFPTDENNADAARTTARILGGVIVEFSPDGKLVKHIAIADLIDPTRIGRDSLQTSWPSNHVPPGEPARDWDHANAVIYEKASDCYYVSLRHQDAIIKVNRKTQQLVWILGTPANWNAPWKDKLLTPVGDLKWQYHQHAVELTPRGLGLYDNGNYRAAAFEPVGSDPPYSRAVIYEIDEDRREVREVWSYGEPSGDLSFYSQGMGDADWQPQTGNLVMVNSELVDGPTTYAQILEVKPDGTRVFDLTVRGATGSVYALYRADRIADIRK